MDSTKKDKKVWILDDDSGILEVTTIVLEEEGYNTTSIQNEQELRDNLKKDQPHILLLDILMSGADGREIAQSLKKNEKTAPIRIIIMSADSQIELKAKEAKADDFLCKPFNIDDLIKKVEKWLP